ncbi:hypothetical protein AS156_36445 [Bradyrhizobium macuxiense]|uniref:Uncharacterized protein n=1 Tax=Bradyrhizobium macuxiense TaxID=1755647 RepID=A0A109K016_9BRAD|nr:hypothetical protein [Bradyrhizobium macuxiense]KWV58283.1 hypothetical protein AS156_36445 [Bradyrhizobium macuxiense]
MSPVATISRGYAELLSWSHFPVNLLVADYGLRRWVPKLIWLVIPLEYYVITRFSGGVSTESYLSAVIFSVICVLSFLLAGFVLAGIMPVRADLQSRRRGAVAALLIVWGTSLLLIALSYWLTHLFYGYPKDILADLIFDVWPSGHSPHKPSFQNFISHLGYAALAAIIDSLVIRGISKLRLSGGSASETAEEPPAIEWIYEPNLAFIAVVVALLMMLLHATTIAEFTGVLKGWGA